VKTAFCPSPVAEDGGPTIQLRRLCREAWADHSERRARRVIAAGKRAINASGEIGSARCAAGFAAAADGPGEALAPGGAADGNATHDAERTDAAVGADIADDRL